MLSARDLATLRFVSEQYAVRVDQLARLHGCGVRAEQYTLARLRSLGLVTTARLLADQPGWVWLTGRGQRLCGTGLRRWQPRVGLLAHVGAVSDVRLHVAQRSSGSEWICERWLLQERAGSEHVPDGVVLTDGREDAVEVELTVKSQGRLVAILEELSARYSAVVYFCVPAVRRRLEGLGGVERWPALQIRDLPGDRRAA